MAKKEKGALEERETELDADHAEKRVYELGFHLDPELPSEEVKKTYDGIRKLIASIGEIIAEGTPEKIQLAYTISRGETAGRRDFNSAFFCWIAYETDGAGHEAVAAAARAESRIVRFLDVRTDKEAAKHFAEMHELLAKAANEAATAEEAETPETEVSDTELDAALKEVGAGVS